MQSHFVVLVLFSFFVAVVFAALARDNPREQLRFGAVMFGSLVAAAIVLSWLMYPLPL